MRGYIHSFESFGTVDGPGIRFVIFFSGCPLRCLYCHNPDSHILTNGKLFDTSELVNKVKKYKSYYGSNGGVTISGGEPLMQLDFLIELTKKLKDENIHVCVDTSGYFFNKEDKRYLELIKYVDLFLLDIKHIDDNSHIKLTKVSNKNILDFALFLDEHKKDVWIRHVLVPNYTTDVESLSKLKEFLNKLKNIKKVEILPFHKLGEAKYKKLNIPYELYDVSTPTLEDISTAKSILNINDK